ncbi:MAG: sulfurtransferase complex subunit TusB [Pseudomonadaceae bacterium]|nr:MAG: sulfurtransferase complex subunit TusB [Pseudomonadaceae bacterium]
MNVVYRSGSVSWTCALSLARKSPRCWNTTTGSSISKEPWVILHIVRHSPVNHPSFSSCLRSLGSGHGMLLIEDAIYALLPGTAFNQSLRLLPTTVSIHVLESDLLARGIALDDLPARIRQVNYLDMVALCTEHSKVVSW